jgi:hypothetical protein
VEMALMRLRALMARPAVRRWSAPSRSRRRSGAVAVILALLVTARRQCHLAKAAANRCELCTVCAHARIL